MLQRKQESDIYIFMKEKEKMLHYIYIPTYLHPIISQTLLLPPQEMFTAFFLFFIFSFS